MNERLPKFKSEKLFAEISDCARGLTYISETDAAIEPVSFGRAASVDVRKIVAGDSEKTRIQEISFEDFFRRPAETHDWFRDDEKLRARRFAKLRDLLKYNLHDLKVFRIGDIQIEIFVVGVDADNNLTGIKTKAVET
jgi:hypothetical protein